MIVEEIPSSVRLRGFFEVLRVNFYDLKKIKNTSLQEAYYQVMINLCYFFTGHYWIPVPALKK
jgi:hypothetical protein